MKEIYITTAPVLKGEEDTCWQQAIVWNPGSDEKRTLHAHGEHEHRLAALSTEISGLEQRILRYAVGAGATAVTIGLTAARLFY